MGLFFTHVLNLPPAFHGQTHSGRLMKVMLTGADHLSALGSACSASTSRPSWRSSSCCRWRSGATRRSA
jgi:hypothetical protein